MSFLTDIISYVWIMEYSPPLPIAYQPETYSKVHGPDMKTLPPPPLGIFEDSDFWTPCYMTIQYLLVCTQNTGA